MLTGGDAQVYRLTREDHFRVSVPTLLRIGLHERVELRLFDGGPEISPRWRVPISARSQRYDPRPADPADPESATVTCCRASNFLGLAVARTFADVRVRVWAETHARLDLPKPALGELAGDTGLVVDVSRRVALDAGVLVGRAKDRLVVAVLGGLSVRRGP